MEKILLAEDDGNLRNLFELLIQDNFPDYLIESFEEGNSLVERLEKDVREVGVVITDNMMLPGICGSEIIRRYARKPKFKDIAFILCCGDDSLESKSIEDGAFAFIPKPISIIEYNRILSDALSYS